VAEVEVARQQVAEAARRLAQEGLILGASGNVSARVDDTVVVTPTGGRCAELEPDDMAVVGMDGTPEPGSPGPTSELSLHLGAYERHGAGAVIHTHSPIATAVSCVAEEVPVVHYGMLAFGGAVRVAPYRTFGTPELADAVLDALEGKRAALMANHGTVVLAGDPAEGVELSLLLEWCCEVYSRASALGSPRVLTDEEQQDVIRSVIERGYGEA
jgi:L-fuculose-phosphate aldolase